MRCSIFYEASQYHQNTVSPDFFLAFTLLQSSGSQVEARDISHPDLCNTVAEVSRSLMRTQELICCTLMAL